MKIESGSGQSKTLQKQIRVLSTAERVQRGAKSAGTFFGFAVVSVFVPVMHFFLVPLFLLLSLYFGITKFRNTKCVELEGVTCPACDKPFKEKNLFFHEDFVRLYCYECQTQLKIS